MRLLQIKNRGILRCLGIIHTMGWDDEPFVSRFVDDPGPLAILSCPNVYSAHQSKNEFLGDFSALKLQELL